ncbi:MAG: hypothetical protein ACAH59_10925 [Pseudobdellovibrionaceae bacterium]
MAHVEQSIKDYGRKSGFDRGSREYKVTPAPILWQNENNRLIYQAFTVLQSGLVAVPLVAGMDKFVNMITDWSQYLSPAFPHLLGMSSSSFMSMIGTIEIGIAIGLALMPRLFSWVLCFWMGAIILNLLSMRQHYDMILVDFGLTMAAFALGKLSQIKEDVPVVVTEGSELSTPELAN